MGYLTYHRGRSGRSLRPPLCRVLGICRQFPTACVNRLPEGVVTQKGRSRRRCKTLICRSTVTVTGRAGGGPGREGLRRDVAGVGSHGYQRGEIGVVQAQLVVHAGGADRA